MILAKFGPIPCKDFDEVKAELQHYLKSARKKFQPRTFGVIFQILTYEGGEGVRLVGTIYDKATVIAFNEFNSSQVSADNVDEVLS